MHSQMLLWSKFRSMQERFKPRESLCMLDMHTHVLMNSKHWFEMRKSNKCPLDIYKLEHRQNLYSRHKIPTSIKRLAPCSFIFLSKQSTFLQVLRRDIKRFSQKNKRPEMSINPRDWMTTTVSDVDGIKQGCQNVPFWIWVNLGFLKESPYLVLALACCRNTEKGIGRKVRQVNVSRGIDLCKKYF